MNKVRETLVDQLDMGSLTQIKSFDDEIKKLSELLVKLNPITEQISNRIASLRNDASYYNGMLNSDTSSFQYWFNQSNYKQNFSNIKTMINTAQKLLSDESVDETCQDSDYDWMEACGEVPNCYYEGSCNQTCSYTPDCEETGQDVYVIDDDGDITCTHVGEGCTETCGECGEMSITTPDPVSECSLLGCDDAACMEQIPCAELCTEVIDCDQSTCSVCTHGTSTGELPGIIDNCSNGTCSYTVYGLGDQPDDCTFGCTHQASTIGHDCNYDCTFTGFCTLDDCTFDCAFNGSPLTGGSQIDSCAFSCNVGAIDCDVTGCSYDVSGVPDDTGKPACNETVFCGQTITCTQPCGLTICDDSAGCSEQCEHDAEDCGNCFYGGCEAGDGDCGDCSDCGDCGDCSDGVCSHDCSDGTDTCGEDCGDSCGLI